MPDEQQRRAGDMVGKGSSTAELLYGSLSGMAFGLVSPIAGQPFDVVKTKMQADTRFLTASPFSVVKKVVASDGVRGMYRGLLPILASTGVQKTVLFTANAGTRRAVEQSGISLLNEAIPGSGGLKPGVLIGGVASAAARTVVETPFELIKVRLQTGGSGRASIDPGRKSRPIRTVVCRAAACEARLYWLDSCGPAGRPVGLMVACGVAGVSGLWPLLPARRRHGSLGMQPYAYRLQPCVSHQVAALRCSRRRR